MLAHSGYCQFAPLVPSPRYAAARPSTTADGGYASDDAYEFDEEIEVSPEDEAALAAFMAPGADSYHQKTLADMVLEKIRERQAAAGVAELPR